MLLTIQIYVLVLFVLLLLFLAYNRLGTVSLDEADRVRLEKANLNLQTIVRLLEAPDTQHLLKNPKTRLYVFREYADSLKHDVWTLVRSGQLRLSSALLALLFFGVFYLLQLKALIHCRAADLMLLGRLELVIVRSLAG
ncbi:MAG: hypothetical protein P8020_06555 [Acidobacteriota bacterium]